MSTATPLFRAVVGMISDYVQRHQGAFDLNAELASVVVKLSKIAADCQGYTDLLVQFERSLERTAWLQQKKRYLPSFEGGVMVSNDTPSDLNEYERSQHYLAVIATLHDLLEVSEDRGRQAAGINLVDG